MQPVEIADAAGQRAARALTYLVDPHGGPSERKLRAAVQGSVILVTGASYGIGEATARQLGAAGATVLLVARSAERLEEIRSEIEAGGGSAFVYPADLRDGVQVDELAARILERHGRVDVLVNNAGKSIRRSLANSEGRFHDFERTIDVNYLGPVRLLMALLPSMRARGRGHVVNISTVGVRGLPPAPGWAAYQASKAAFDVFLRSAAPELRADGIATTSIYMTLVHTRMSAPIAIWRYLPGLAPEEAADLVCRAIVQRPRAIGPWWRKPGEITTALLPGAIETMLGAGHTLSDNATHGGVGSGTRLGRLVAPARSGAHVAKVANAVVRSGALAPVRPDRVPRLARAVRQLLGTVDVGRTERGAPSRPSGGDRRARADDVRRAGRALRSTRRVAAGGVWRGAGARIGSDVPQPSWLRPGIAGRVATGR